MTDQNPSNTRTWLIVGVVAAFVMIAAVVAALASGSDENPTTTEVASGDGAIAATEISETRPVTLTGDALPIMPEQGSDPALGLIMPDLRGQSFDGTPIEITNDGRPKIILFLAHW